MASVNVRELLEPEGNEVLMTYRALFAVLATVVLNVLTSKPLFCTGDCANAAIEKAPVPKIKSARAKLRAEKK